MAERPIIDAYLPGDLPPTVSVNGAGDSHAVAGPEGAAPQPESVISEEELSLRVRRLSKEKLQAIAVTAMDALNAGEPLTKLQRQVVS
ncbi:MAG TPA: hypothetical protein VF261_03235, partial [Candidatus Saccharimonadales bacterium]